MGLRETIRWGYGVCAVVCCVVAPGAMARVAQQRRPVVLTPWEQAERGRETLEAIPEETRTRADYARAMDGFRAVYHDAPGDVHAPDSVNAVAELLLEQGRGLHDEKSLKAAVGQYEFLRTQYPGSSLRVGALLAEGQIEEDDLHDAGAARERYALLVKKYPRSTLAEEAQAGLDSLDEGRGRREEGKGKREESALGGGAEVVRSGQASDRGVGSRASSGASGSGETASSFPPMPVTGAAPNAVAPVASADARDASTQGVAIQDGEIQGAAMMHVAKAAARGRGQLARVTGIRHWSTPTYTRVAIDLGDDVTYEAARVPNPDRIYFDLHGTRLAQELVGKSFAVTDDGFLKKIRAAQFSNDMTRVVLDVNDVTEYSAFLLPDPYRLIIDIHGGQPGTGSKEQRSEEAAPAVEIARGETPAPRVAAVLKATQARPVPNTVATTGSSTFDVAALSAQPDKVEATSQPTSSPISAVVKGQGTVAGGDAPMPAATKRLRRSKAAKDADALPARAAVPTADGETSLVRALGLKIGRIVIDAGHGGHDSGTLGVDGIEEKDVVLDVALRLGKLLHDRLGSEIIYTRSDDTFIPLETRTAIANKAQADLFLSIHANSSSDESARGVETYYLNFTTSPDALETAARENAVSDQSIHQLSDLVKKIALKDKIAESREFASDVQQGLYGGLQRGNSGLKDRGVKKAPFVVLIGANMPSILAEISFVTNEKDAKQLREPEYRERVAESLYKGVAKYAGGLSGTRVPTERASAN
jgi:N-acetylmuramoyl-L-alanine amidase